MAGRRVPHDVYVQIAGVDIVRTDDHGFYVLEDNARTPSGVSYMLENREVMMRLFPDLFSMHRVAPIEDYPDELLATLRSVAPPRASHEPTIALMTPGQYNSAYYEHSFLADKLGVELVEGRDLFVKTTCLYAHDRRAASRRRYLPPHRRRLPRSAHLPPGFGPGRSGADRRLPRRQCDARECSWHRVADDKAMYTYMPDIIRFYLGQEPLLQNVPTWRCRSRSAFLCARPSRRAGGQRGQWLGGYGMLGRPARLQGAGGRIPRKAECATDNFIAQPTLALSTCPISVAEGIAPRMSI